jgi:hypothetical protein
MTIYFRSCCLAALMTLSASVVGADAVNQQNYSPYQKGEVAVEKFFAGRYSKENIVEIAAGDLNKDGTEDLAIILGSLNFPQIAVLYGSPSGEYKIGDLSRNFCTARYHFNVEVKGQSLFVTTVHSLGPSTHTYQFKSRKDRLVLIGLEESNLENDQNDGYGKSVNYLTNQVIYWRMNVHKRKEIKKKIPRSPLNPLNDFDCERFEEPRGWIDDDFQFKS